MPHSRAVQHAGARSLASFCALFVIAQFLLSTQADGQSILTAGAATPFKLTETPGGNFLLAESGTGAGDSRVSLLSHWGDRFRLLSGLPSAITFEGSPSGAAAVAQTHRTIYVALGTGDTISSQQPPLSIPNPAGPSSPILSSVLRARFTPVPDGIREGFALTAPNLQSLADGLEVTLTNGSGEQVELLLLTDFRDLTPDPITGVRDSNPFSATAAGSLTQDDLVELGAGTLTLDQANFIARLDIDSPLGRRFEERTSLYVADSGNNTIRQIDAATGRTRVLTRIPPIANPLFPGLGGPVVDAVPTSVHVRADGNLLVGLLTGFPFASGNASLLLVNPTNGAITPYLTGLTTVTDFVEVQGVIYVLEFSTNFLAQAPGRILRFASPGSSPTVVAGGLISPAGLAYDPVRDELLVSEAFTGRIVRVAL